MENPQKPKIDLASVRTRLADKDSAEMWRSLGELCENEEFQQFLDDEFPQVSRPLRLNMDRRQFLTLSGASLALAGLSGCRFLPQDKIVPYVKAPEDQIPGKALYYASATLLGGYARGVLVESHEGRPTNIQGNPDHPATLGSSDAFIQAEVLNLYDPDRSKNVRGFGSQSNLDSFLTSARDALGKQKPSGGAGIRILTETVTSPTLAAQIKGILARYPNAKWLQYDAVSQDSVRQGAQVAFGKFVNTVYQFDKADRILSFDSDFFASGPGSVRYSLDFAKKRKVTSDVKEMNRLYAVESTPKLTGAMADHRFPARASDVEGIIFATAAKLGIAGVTAPADVKADYLDAVLEDLKENSGRSLVIAGDHLSANAHALVHAINAALGNVGKTLYYTDPIEANPTLQIDDLRQLVADIQGNKVEFLLILGANPVYNAPVDMNFGQVLTSVAFSVHQGLHYDETGNVCQWHIPETHSLEAWGDGRAFDGTTSIIQPLIRPIYENAKSVHELLSALFDRPQTSEEVVKNYWRGVMGGADFEKKWRKNLNDGLIPATAAAPITVALVPTLTNGMTATELAKASDQNLEIIFAPDPTVWDGRFANNPWLQELPKPMTKLTWDNAVLMSVNTAEKLGVQNEDTVELELNGHTVKGPVWIAFGHPDHSVTVHLGYGRLQGGAVAAGGKGIMPVNGWDGAGFDANKLRSSGALWFTTGVAVKKVGGTWQIATTENHHAIENGKLDSQYKRDIIRLVTLEEYKQGKTGAPEHGEEAHAAPAPAHGAEAGHGKEAEHGGEHEEHSSLYPKVVGGSEEKLRLSPESYDYNEFSRWGMVIDLNTCTGCNACTIACQSENNIAVVGKDLVMRGREMHWIRIDRYYKGTPDNPQTYFQPLGCQHCELAPCEPVCPVAATLHSHDGLNQMVYNRCVGTKYCSNNCPYKVRRFNFLNYGERFEEPYTVLTLARNPNVTIRSRGVMEKCTFCVQRISAARIEAKKANRPIGGDEIVTACQQACPSSAIVFGDLNVPESKVAKAKAQPQGYLLLDELNTKSRVTYLARLRNPNPKLGSGKES
jgi:molybdopterin-containing oxidoreductase family iron-sulfur binding subunit